MSTSRILGALAALLLASLSLEASHEWVCHPDVVKGRFTSAFKGDILGVEVITNKFPPKGILYPGIGLFTNLLSRGAVFSAYNRWEGPEVGGDYDLAFDKKKIAWSYWDVDEPRINFKCKNRKFSYAFPQKEWCELDFCLVLGDDIYHVKTGAKSSKLNYAGTLGTNIAEGVPLEDEVNVLLHSVSTNNWLIGEGVPLATANGVAYKGALVNEDRSSVKVSFNAKTWTLSHKIADPVGRYVLPGYTRELGVEYLELDGVKLENGASGPGYLFTNDVLVLENYVGQNITFIGGLDIMCPAGTTNVFEGAPVALNGTRGFCNLLGEGRLVLRGSQEAVKCDDCAMLLDEIDSFNADRYPEVVVMDEQFLSAPEELTVDGVNAIYHKRGEGWSYDLGVLYLDNFNGGRISCDGNLKVVLQPGTHNTVSNLLEASFGTLEITGPEAVLDLASLDLAYGDLRLESLNLDLNPPDGGSGIYVLGGNCSISNCVVTMDWDAALAPDQTGITTADGSVLIRDSHITLVCPENEVLYSDLDLTVENSVLNCTGETSFSETGRIAGSNLYLDYPEDMALAAFGDFLVTNSYIWSSGSIDVLGDMVMSEATLNLTNQEQTISLDAMGALRLLNSRVEAYGTVYVDSLSSLDGVLELGCGENDNALCCFGDLAVSNTSVKACGTLHVEGYVGLFDSDVTSYSLPAAAAAIYSTGTTMASNLTLIAEGGLDLGTNACLNASKLTVSAPGQNCLTVDERLEMAGSELQLWGEMNGLVCFGQVDMRNCVFASSIETNEFFSLGAMVLTVAGGSVGGFVEGNELTLEGGASMTGILNGVTVNVGDAMVEGCVECTDYVQTAGRLVSRDWPTGLKAANSVTFKGGDADIESLAEAVSCPAPAKFADDSSQSLAGCTVVRVQEGLLKKAE